jgi:hypothetical protein
MKNEDNIKAWVEQGMPDDFESLEKFGITDKQIRKLEKRVMSAVAAKMLANPDKITFAQHKTIQ